MDVSGVTFAVAALRKQPSMSLNNSPHQVSVVVNAVPGNDGVVVRPPARSYAAPRGVTVTPLSTQPPSQLSTRMNVVGKVLLKAVSKNGKKNAKTFTLRNISVPNVNTCSLLKNLIRAQLWEDITHCDFDVGYLSGTNVISICNKDDLCEIWANLLKGDKITLWCDGLERNGEGRKRKADSDSDDSDVVSKPKGKLETGKTVYRRFLKL